MSTTPPGALLRPALDRGAWGTTRMGSFLETIEAKYCQRFDAYEDAWRWSVENVEDFWSEVWDHFDVISHSPYTAVLPERTMPGAQWFPGATLNYTEHVLRRLRERAEDVIVTSRSQTNGSVSWTGSRLEEEIARVQAGLIARGIRRGDRVVGYLPNIPETLAAYLATTALGAIWCAVPPEMGPQSVLDRITQLAPKLLIAVDGYVYGRREQSRSDELARILGALPATQAVLLPYLGAHAEALDGVETWAQLTGRVSAHTSPAAIHIEPVPFDHPLTVLFSSGTTGRPKAIVHCHGGILLEHLKALGLHYGISEQDTTFWFTTTGWMMWTLGMSSLLLGASVVMMDGDPNWPAIDGEWSQWAVVAETGATYMSTGSAYLSACAHAGMAPGQAWDLSRLREVLATGSPLAADVAGWVLDTVSPDVLLAATSGGTDICSGFLGASPLTPVWAGEMSCRALGVAVEAWDLKGDAVRGAAGELVCTQPMPSMPAFFWGDADFQRYRDSYFDAYPGVWRHGDWLVETERGSWVITGRSDATLNRGGVRLGTAEFYAVLDSLSGVKDTLVLHFEDSSGMGTLVLIVAATGGVDHTELEGVIRTAMRTELSPRHLPDHVTFVPGIPRTATGKRLEIPLKRIIQGALPEDVMDPEAAPGSGHIPAIVAGVRQVLAEARTRSVRASTGVETEPSGKAFL